MCEHKTNEGYKYCPYCGKELALSPRDAMKKFRKYEREYCRKFFHVPVGTAIWDVAYDRYAVQLCDRLTVYNCPPDAAEKVLEIAERIEGDVIAAFGKHAPSVEMMTRSEDGEIRTRPYRI